MKSWFAPRRATEATSEQLIASGAAGTFGYDPIDGDVGFRPAGSKGFREIPTWTLEKARAYSVNAYRTNPMARAIIDTYTSFCVGDSGVTLQCSNGEVRGIAEAFWTDPKNALARLQEPMLRDHMLMGEQALEMMVGGLSGVTRFSVIDPSRIIDVTLEKGNPLWPASVLIRTPGADMEEKQVVAIDDLTALRSGDVQWWTSWKALLTDRRGFPFLGPVLDDLDSYDTVLSNLVDRTALARYLVFDVTMKGADQKMIDNWVRERGGTHVPRSGTIEAHNDSVEWDVKQAQSGSFEDTNTSKAILTNVAGGTGLAKTWLAEPEDANRATSLTMAEPVRRRVGGVQNLWLHYQTELVRFAVDQAVAARRIPAEVDATDAKTGHTAKVPAAMTVSVTGPEVATADTQVTAQILVNLSQGLGAMQAAGILTQEAAKVAARKAWEQFVGIPYTADLDQEDGSRVDDLTTEIEKAQSPGVLKLA